MTEALGLIEVIGYPPAVEAADAALKAANVKLASITKVDGGIMTVQIFGDVGAVKAAVDAAGAAAARVGKVRATHVIPRVDPALSKVFLNNSPKKEVASRGTIEKDKTTSSESLGEVAPPESIGSRDDKQEVSQVVSGDDTVSDLGPVEEVQIDGLQEVQEVDPELRSDTQQEQKPQALESAQSFSPTELTKLSNTELKNLITSLGIKVAPRKLKSARKDELIHIIIQFYKEGEN